MQPASNSTMRLMLYWWACIFCWDRRSECGQILLHLRIHVRWATDIRLAQPIKLAYQPGERPLGIQLHFLWRSEPIGLCSACDSSLSTGGGTKSVTRSELLIRCGSVLCWPRGGALLSMRISVFRTWCLKKPPALIIRNPSLLCLLLHPPLSLHIRPGGELS